MGVTLDSCKTTDELVAIVYNQVPLVDTWEEVFSYYDVLLLLLVLFCCLRSFQNLFVALLVTQQQLLSHMKKVWMVSHILINSLLVDKVR